MIRRGPIGVLALLVTSACQPSGDDAAETQTAAASARDTVVLETSAGQITVELFADAAPVSVENFLLHVRSGFYDGLVFHRVEPEFVIQVGELDTAGNKRISPVFPIENEAGNGLSNTRGTLGMARTGDPHSATSQFFINLADNAAKLDHRDSTEQGFGYAVFGRVVAGMDVVDSIARIPTRRTRSYPYLPSTPAVVTRARIVSGRSP